MADSLEDEIERNGGQAFFDLSNPKRKMLSTKMREAVPESGNRGKKPSICLNSLIWVRHLSAGDNWTRGLDLQVWSRWRRRSPWDAHVDPGGVSMYLVPSTLMAG